MHIELPYTDMSFQRSMSYHFLQLSHAYIN